MHRCCAAALQCDFQYDVPVHRSQQRSFFSGASAKRALLHSCASCAAAVFRPDRYSECADGGGYADDVDLHSFCCEIHADHTGTG